jgi:hypothetical protein
VGAPRVLKLGPTLPGGTVERSGGRQDAEMLGDDVSSFLPLLVREVPVGVGDGGEDDLRH